jgi:hypothetical protein
MGPANAPPLSSEAKKLAAIDDIVSRADALNTLYFGKDWDLDYDSDEDEDEDQFKLNGESYSPPLEDPLSRAHDRLESIEDLYSGVPFDSHAVIVLAKPGDLDIDRLRERAASLESCTSKLVPRLLALERCFEKVPTPEPEETYQGTDLVGRLNDIELKAFGFDQSGMPHDLVGRLTAMELKARFRSERPAFSNAN